MSVPKSKWPGALIQLHLAIFLWGFTAILGKWISLRELELVWLRIMITIPCLLFFPKVFTELRELKLTTILLLMGIGFIVATHWVLFYGAIKRSNVSLTLSTFATTAIFTAFLEPLVSRRKIDTANLVYAIIACCGIVLVLSTSYNYLVGIIWGVLAAFTSALFSTINKAIISGKGSYSITFVELSGGLLFLSLYFYLVQGRSPATIQITTLSDLVGLFLLAFMCTAIPFVISLNALRHVSAFTANLSLNLEPVYGIILAAFIFKEHEQLNTNFYLGTLTIISTVFLHARREAKQRRESLAEKSS